MIPLPSHLNRKSLIQATFPIVFGAFVYCFSETAVVWGQDNSTPAAPTAQMPPEFQEIWKKSQILRSAPSFDTTPVDIKVGEITYRIPRNYLDFQPVPAKAEMQIPVLKVTYPGFAPHSEQTANCYQAIWGPLGDKCYSIKFDLEAYHPIRSILLENSRRIIKNKEPIKGPFGYDIYLVGPEDNRMEIYYKEIDEGEIFFECQIHHNRGYREGFCIDTVPLIYGNSAHFFFDLEKIGLIPEYETGLRLLMENFRIKETKQ